jgi:bifunctional NMN adenylyltransferase/nudix hydrolase
MTRKYNTLVFIGRFQPFHSAHLEIVKRATALADKLIIVCGSAHQPRTYKNPFTSAERERMIRDATHNYDIQIHVEHNMDTIYNDQAWAGRVQALVAKHRIDESGRVGIIGHRKDESSFYLNMFPQWALEEVPMFEPLDATSIRDLFFRWDYNSNFIRNVVPDSTYRFLQGFRNTEDFAQVIREREFIERYRLQYASLPYPPVFVTTDAVVICSGHVLMIRRRAEPGRGLWALPGGFLDAEGDRSVESCMLRELREETGIKVPVPVLKGSIVGNRVFDAPGRSTRGRTITHAFHLVLSDTELPKVRGGDDADRATWVPLGLLNSNMVYEDHYEIISNFVGA